MPLRHLCFERPPDELLRIEVLLPCVVAVSWAAFEVWQERFGMDRVAGVAGHSLGEFSALAAAGVMSWETALTLVEQEGRICARTIAHTPGCMIAIVGLDYNQIDRIRDAASSRGALWVANFNAPDQFVLSGETGAIAEAGQLAVEAGAWRVLVLNVAVPAHSPMMFPAVDAYRALIYKLELSAPRRPVIANGSGKPMTTVEAVRAELAHHMVRPVLWSRTMVSMRDLHVRTVVELGTGRMLASLAVKNLPGMETWTANELFIEALADPHTELASWPNAHA